MKKIQLSIENPCGENWAAMKPEEKGRFCASCQKTVIDFTTMSDRQLAQFFKTYQGSVCGRLHPDQTDRELALPTKRIPWLRYFFTVSLPAFLLSLKASSQARPAPIAAVAEKDPAQKDSLPEPGKRTVTGKLTDVQGRPVPFATIGFGPNQFTMADTAGRFSVRYFKPTTLQVSCIGYQTRTVAVDDSTREVSVILEPEVRMDMGIVVISRAVSKKATPLTKKPLERTNAGASAGFGLYPNPAPQNGALTLDLQKLAKGTYRIVLVNASGDVLQTETRELQKGDRVAYPVSVPAGVYFLRLEKDGKEWVQKFIVQ